MKCNVCISIPGLALVLFVVDIICWGDFGCELDRKKEKLQIAIVADITEEIYKSVKEVLASKCEAIMETLNKLYDDTEFALTVFASWESSAYIQTENVSGRHNDSEGCYTNLRPFTTNAKAVSHVASTIELKIGASGREDENGLPAIAFAVCDKLLRWIVGDVDKKNRTVHKIVILITDVFSHFELPFPGNRTEFSGNGADTCVASLPPTREAVGKILHDRKTKIIGAYVGMTQSAFEQYTDFFDEYDIPHNPRIFKDRNDFDLNIVPFVKEKVVQLLACYYEDPIGYNSLGL